MDLIRRIENEIEKKVLQRPFLKNSLSYCLWYLLLTHEEFIRLPMLMRLNYDIGALIDNGKYGLKYSFTWAYKVTRDFKEFQRPSYINERGYSEAFSLFNQGLNYEGIESAYVMYSRGLAKAQILDSCTIRFVRQSDEIRYDVLDKLIVKTRAKEAVIESLLIMNSYLTRKNIAKVLSSIRRNDPESISYNLPISVFTDILSDLGSILDKIFIFPDTWSFNGISIKLFRDIWRVLTVRCMIHHICHLHAGLVLRMIGGARLSVVLLYDYDELIDEVSILLDSNNKQEISTVINLLIYDSTLPYRKRDIGIQPLVKLSDKIIALAPQLLMGSNHERNMMAFLARHHKNEYDRTTDILEDLLIDNFVEELSSTGLLIDKRRKIPGHKELPDIDLVIGDPINSSLLVIELKWVIAPAESWEILERAEAELQGIKQAEKIFDFFKKDPNKLWRLSFNNIKEPNSLSLYACVVMRGFCGTAKNWREDIPVIEYSLIIDKTRETKNIKEVSHWLKEREFLPVEDKDYRIVDIPCEIDNYKIIWGGFELTGT